jgi:hypothetical protein
LDLGANSIGDKGLQAFTDSMTVNKLIRTISLLGNKRYQNDEDYNKEQNYAEYNQNSKDALDMDRFSSSIVSDLDLDERPSMISDEVRIFFLYNYINIYI